MVYTYVLLLSDWFCFETRSSYTEEPDWDNVLWFKLPLKVNSPASASWVIDTMRQHTSSEYSAFKKNA